MAAVEIDRAALPASTVLRAFTPEHLRVSFDDVEVGAPLLIVGVPLGMQDTVHHLPVARQAMIASSFGLRFQGHGYFLTDARTHRGMSGAPVVMRWRDPGVEADGLPWKLLGRALGATRHGPARPGTGRNAGLELCLVCLDPGHADGTGCARNDSPRAAARNATAIA